MLRQEFCQQFDLSSELPADIQRLKESYTERKRKREEAEAEAEEYPDSSVASASLYPVEDLLLPEAHLVKPPPACSDFSVDPKLVGDMLMIFCFIASFREQLGLQEEPTLVDVENLLRATEPSSFGSELLTCLLKTVLPDSHPMTAKLNENTWPVILRKWLREEQPRLCFDTSFPQLQMEQKLDLLSYLAHVALDSVAIRQILDETAETGPAGESEAAPQVWKLPQHVAYRILRDPH